MQDFFESISKYKDELSSEIKNDVAIVYDYDSLASFRIQRQSLLLDPPAEMQKFYKAFYDVNVGVDIIPWDRDFLSYKIVILPQLIITKPEMEKKIKEFVENGGTVVLTYRCAIKDEDNNVPFGKTIPVNYNELTGITVEETESLQEYDAFPVIGHGDYKKINGYGGIFRDMIKDDETAEMLFSYGDLFYMGYAAVTRKIYEKGSVYYIGCGLEEKILKLLMETAMNENNIQMFPTEDGVEIVERGSENHKIKMYINHNQSKIAVDGMELEAFECKIVKQ